MIIRIAARIPKAPLLAFGATTSVKSGRNNFISSKMPYRGIHLTMWYQTCITKIRGFFIKPDVSVPLKLGEENAMSNNKELVPSLNM
jgi:hypothetical protein